MATQSIIQNSSDFLFVYEAIQSNPNGDPDQENKPRMDYDTKTNLVTDTRIKRFIRDHLKETGVEIFVDMEGNNKVSMDSKLKAVVKRTIENKKEMEAAFQEKPEYIDIYKKVVAEEKDNFEKVWDKITDKKFKNKEVNYELLAYYVKQKFIDIRMFGSAFAVGGFKAYTGPIQLNWGYSLNRVELMDSNTIVTTMNDDSESVQLSVSNNQF